MKYTFIICVNGKILISIKENFIFGALNKEAFIFVST